MRIDILYFAGCPHREITTLTVRTVIHELGVQAEVNEVQVESAEQAAELRFFGSPTVQIDGDDVDPNHPGQTGHSFSCRLYGRAGSPPRAMIERAVRERRRP
jgi:hypothetical protein